ncbi:DUF1992 domain-containing protein [Naasia lichenicola]|uniref:DUF1992 domain-containing protein n=1 Tax=Naasia lichenicola TaxID=2565933 RepID=A0A4S4FPV7_9MICO|nr:DUF1992 domain-containing protein [Naasia lichenicola]THG32321.1 DUF1992 domain-containing protein [Naasia lichenicola]
MADDPRLDVARYQLDKAARERGESVPDEPRGERPAASMQQRAAIAETALQQAFRRGEFDNLPGAGKPLPNLHEVHDPDWWIRKKIERENLTGLGPPALTLRTESAQLRGRIDALHLESDVRAVLDDFNRRVKEARRQLLGGPPVVTPLRDVGAELDAWRERREAARAEETARRQAEAEAEAALTRRERRRLRRSRP